MTQQPELQYALRVVAILVERLGGRVVISDFEQVAFDDATQLVTYRDNAALGDVIEIRKPPVVVAGEVVDGELLALPVSEMTETATDNRMRA